MNMLKRSMAMLMVLCMLISAVPVMAFAAETDDTDSAAVENTEQAEQVTEDVEEEEIAESQSASRAVVLAEGGNTEFIRAFALDCGRLYFSVENIKEIIDVMAANGYTHLTLAFGNSGFRFLLDDMEIGGYSSDAVKNAIQAGNTYYVQNDGHYGGSAANTCLTQADMDAIIAYANGKGIEIIPALNSPGHMNTIVYAMGQLGIDNAGYPVNGSYNSESTLNIDDASVMAFSDALIQKYINYFDGKGCKYFNLGADEFANDPTDDVKLGFNASMKAGFISYVNRVASMISDAGMTPMMFNDGYAWSDANFNKDIVVCYWTGGAVSSTAIANAGHKVINNSQSYYYVLGEPYGSAANNWCSYASATNGVNNVPVTRMVDNGTPGDKLIGAQMWLWCDYTNEVYTAEEETRVKTLLETLAENNPDYFVIPEAPPTPETRNITMQVSGTLTNTIEGKAYTEVQIADPSKVSVQLTADPGIAATVSSTAATELENGATYIIRVENTQYALSKNQKVGSFPNGRALETNNLTVNEDHLWTLEASGSGYKLKNVDGNYLSIGYESASVDSTGEAFTFARTGNGWQIYDSDNYAFNALGGIGYQSLGGWNKNESPLTMQFYKVTMATPASTEVKFTGLAAGTTTVTVGHVTYNVTVSDVQVTETRDITMQICQVVTDTIEGIAVSGSYTPENPAIATVVAEARQKAGNKELVEVTSLDQIISGEKYLIAGATSNKTLTGTVEAHPNRAGETVLNIDGSVNVENPNLWTITKDGDYYYFSPGGNGQYLTFADYNAGLTTELQSAKITLGRRNNSWTIRDQETSAYLTDNANGGDRANGWSDLNDITNMWKIYRLVEEEATTETTVTFTGLEVGETTVTVGNVRYNITVTDVEVTETRDIIVAVGESVTDAISDREYTNAQIANPAIVSVDITTEEAVLETTVSSTAATQLEDGATYILRVYGTNQALSSDRGRGDWGTNTLAFQTNSLTADTKHMWTLEKVDGGYKLKNANGYLNLGSGNNAAYLNATGEVFTITSTATGWAIGNQSGRYINALGGLDAYHSAGGWTGDGTRFDLYKVNEPQPLTTKVTFTGLKEGKTTVIVGDILYNVIVTPENLSAISLTYHPWISTYPIYPEGTGSAGCTNEQGEARNATISAAAAGVYSEQGAEMTSLVPATGDWKWEEDAQTVYWKATVLPEGMHQAGVKTTDHAMDGTDFVYIRYWGGQWEYSADRVTWTAVKSTDEVCVYYLQKTEVTQEVETFVKDWAYTPDTVSGAQSSVYQKALSFAVVYPGGTMHPTEENFYQQSTLIYYDNLANLGFFRIGTNEFYEVEKITYTFGERANPNGYKWTAAETINWEKRTIDGHEWYNETVCWDESYGTEPVVNGENLQDVIYCGEPASDDPKTDYDGSWGRDDAVLILIYLKPVVNEDSLTVVYYDEKFGEVLHTYPITVHHEDNFTDDIGKVTIDGGNVTIDTNNKPGAFAGNNNRIDVTGYGITNNVDYIQRFQTDLNNIPSIMGKYNSELYKYTGSEIRDDGKTLYLYYNFNETALPVYVVDFGQPLSFNLNEITENHVDAVSVVEQTRYGRLSYRETKDIGAIFIYQPTSILQGADLLTINLTFTDGKTSTVNIRVIPATTVYYEEGFAFNENSTGWENTSNKGNYEQLAEILGQRINNYGYDDVYTYTSGASDGTQATTSTIGATTTFTFTGNGIQIFANATENSGYVAVEIKDSTGKVVNVSMVDTIVKGGTTGATSGQEGDLYGLPIVSLVDLQNMPHGTYTVKLTKIMDEEPVYIDGIRVFNTLSNSDGFNADQEDNPKFYELRDYVLNAVEINEETSAYYATFEDIADQVYAGISSNAEAPVAMITDGMGAAGIYGEGATAQDLLDNGPKNELYLYPGQTLSFKVTTGQIMQLGMKAPAGNTSTTITVDGAERNQTVNSTVDMFYSLTTVREMDAEAHLISITNSGSNILSVTLLKVCNLHGIAFEPLTVEDVEQVLQTSLRAAGARSFLLGDVDGDWDVDANDLTMMARHVGGIEPLSDEALENLDVDGNGTVDAYDLTTHARFTGGIIVKWREEADKIA